MTAVALEIKFYLELEAWTSLMQLKKFDEILLNSLYMKESCNWKRKHMGKNTWFEQQWDEHVYYLQKNTSDPWLSCHTIPQCWCEESYWILAAFQCQVRFLDLGSIYIIPLPNNLDRFLDSSITLLKLSVQSVLIQSLEYIIINHHHHNYCYHIIINIIIIIQLINSTFFTCNINYFSEIWRYASALIHPVSEFLLSLFHCNLDITQDCRRQYVRSHKPWMNQNQFKYREKYNVHVLLSARINKTFTSCLLQNWAYDHGKVTC